MTNMINELLKKQREEFNEEWEKSNDWGGGKFGSLEENVGFIADKKGVLDFLSNCQQEIIEAKDREMRERLTTIRKESWAIEHYEEEIDNIINQLNNHEH